MNDKLKLSKMETLTITSANHTAIIVDSKTIEAKRLSDPFYFSPNGKDCYAIYNELQDNNKYAQFAVKIL